MGSLRTVAENAASALRRLFPELGAPVAFVQLDNGMEAAGLFDREFRRVPLADLPGMPAISPPGAARPELLLGESAGVQVLVACGHHHLYEGHGSQACVLPACTAALCGVRNILLAGTGQGIREDLKPGSVVVATDFINNLGTSPLAGEWDLGEDWFLDMTRAFSQELNSGFVNAAADVGLTPRLGTYQANLGPQIETPSEVEVARRNGADVLGMGVVLETIAACALGCRTMATVVVTHRAATVASRRVTYAATRETCRDLSPLLVRALKRYFAREY